METILIAIYLDNFEKITTISKVCEKYTPSIQTDACFGRYIVDAASILGLESLSGKLVTLNPNVKDTAALKEYKEELSKVPGIVMTYGEEKNE